MKTFKATRNSNQNVSNYINSNNGTNSSYFDFKFFLIFILITICMIGCGESEYQKYLAIKSDDSIRRSEYLHKKYVDAQLDSIRIENENKLSKKDQLRLIKIRKEHPNWSPSIINRLLNNEIWIGMSFEMVKFKNGKPDHVTLSNYGEGNQYQWCWNNLIPSCFYGNSNFIITSYN